MTRQLLIADDHQLFLDGLRLLLDRIDGWDIVGEARNGNEVLSFLQTTPVDCILMDIEMPRLNGIDATKRIKKEYPDIKVIAVSMMSDYPVIKRMLQAGADGYLVKSTGIAELRYALEMVTQGQLYISHQVAPVLFEGVAGRKNGAQSTSAALSQREKEIVALIVEGLTNEEIAEKLCLSKLTINTHRKNVLSKLGCKNTAALVKHVIEHKLLD